MSPLLELKIERNCVRLFAFVCVYVCDKERIERINVSLQQVCVCVCVCVCVYMYVRMYENKHHYVLQNPSLSHVCLHPLSVSLVVLSTRRRVVSTRRRSVREAGGPIIPQHSFRTRTWALALDWSLHWPWSHSLSSWVDLIGRPSFQGRGKAHPIGRVLGGIAIVVIGQLTVVVQ